MSEIIYVVISCFIFSLFGAYFVKAAVLNFKEGNYYWFGLNIFFALVQVAYMFKTVFDL